MLTYCTFGEFVPCLVGKARRSYLRHGQVAGRVAGRKVEVEADEWDLRYSDAKLRWRSKRAVNSEVISIEAVKISCTWTWYRVRTVKNGTVLYIGYLI